MKNFKVDSEQGDKPASVSEVSTSNLDPRFQSWRQLVAKFRGDARFCDDPIYALPEKLINAICTDVPGLFSSDDETMERSLTKLAGQGFFLGRSIAHPSLPVTLRGVDLSSADRKLKEDFEGAAERNREMLIQEMRERGLSDQEVARHVAADKAYKQKIAERQAGYVGWLVTNPEFHRDRDQFRNRWEAKIDARGRFPHFPISMFGELPESPPLDDREYHSDWTQFYKRWSLDHLVTWDLPVPMRPQLTSFNFYRSSDVSEAGVVLFAPWYLLRDKDITLRDVAEQRSSISMPPEIAPWVQGMPKNWGHERYGVMLAIYIYLECCLKKRYGARLKGKTEALDLAMSRYYCDQSDTSPSPDSKVDTIGKIRKEMAKRIKAASESAS